MISPTQTYVTPQMIEAIKARLRSASKPRLNQTQVAQAVGHGRSWMSRILAGEIRTISDDDLDRLEDVLGTKLFVVREVHDNVPPQIQELAERAKTFPELAKLLSAVIDYHDAAMHSPVSLPWIPTQDMTRIGQEIIRLVFGNEDKPGKVAREVISMLTNLKPAKVRKKVENR